MKKKSKKVKVIKKISKLIENFSINQIESKENRTKKTIEIEVSSNEDITSYIKALLEVCYYALDGNGLFISPANRGSFPEPSVTKVIELVMDLLPHNQMYCLDKIEGILYDEQNMASEKKNNKQA